MKLYLWVAALAACGGHTRDPIGPAPVRPPLLEPTVAEQSWYRSTTSCAQGPFELAIAVGAARYGEAVELSVRAPRRIAIHATITAGDSELATIDDTFDASGRVGGSADNARCVADARERLAAERARRTGTQGPATTPGSSGSVTTPNPGAPATSAPPPASVTATLEVVPPAMAVGVTSVVQVQIPRGATSIRIRWWSIEPNDLDGVQFGLSHVVWKPDIGEQAYEAYLAEQEAKRVAEENRQAELRAQAERDAQERDRVRAAQEEARMRANAELDLKRKREDDERRRHEAQAHVNVTATIRTSASVTATNTAVPSGVGGRVVIDDQVRPEGEEARRLRIEAELRAQREADARRAAEEQHRLKIEAELQIAEDNRRRKEAQAAEQRRLKLEAELRAAEERKHYCATHGEDRSCWGPGGLAMKLQLDARSEQRTTYCAQHHEDARCWTDDDRQRIAADDQARMAAALTPPSKPDGPPPAALAETIPPKLSTNATWRPGYWQWVDKTWVWLAGMWRVPEEDIVAEHTTMAPTAPPAPQIEAPSAAPVASAVWLSGFWQWDGARWIWIAGSWQLRPSMTVTWRAATWQPRGSMHILVPGAWVRIGGSR